MDQSETQRALGRIEGTLEQVLGKLDKLSGDFGEHKNEDQRNFSSVRQLLYTKLKENDAAREKHLGEQDVKLDALKTDSDRAKGAGWVILGLLGAVATFIGTAVLSVLNGWITFKIH